MKNIIKEILPILFILFSGHVIAVDFQVVDLTHVQSTHTLYWPGNPAFNFTILFRNRTQVGYWYESDAFQTAEHGGTHLDAPAHFAEGNQRTHQIPLQNLIGPGVIINVKSKVANNADYRVTVSDLQSWENKNGPIPDGAVVIMNSGWASKYPNKTLTFGSQTPGVPSTFHFPGWHKDAVDWLIKKKKNSRDWCRHAICRLRPIDDISGSRASRKSKYFRS